MLETKTIGSPVNLDKFSIFIGYVVEEINYTSGIMGTIKNLIKPFPENYNNWIAQKYENYKLERGRRIYKAWQISKK